MDPNARTRDADDGDGSPQRERLRGLIEAARSQAASATHATSAAGSGAGEQEQPFGVDAGLDATGRALAALLPGYTLTREVRRGGQGLVYEAMQNSTNRRVAIKVMREGPFAGEADLARFDREVKILAQLHHPNIVTIHDSGRAGGHFYFVMDFIAGRPLDEFAAGTGTAGRADIREILKLFERTCVAVSAAHLRGVIHRDIKPGNILVDGSGNPLVLDFGLAKATGSLVEGDEDGNRITSATAARRATTMAGQFLGSLPWASPEQVAGNAIGLDVRTDVYSLGVMLYQALTGRFPYDVFGPLREVMNRIAQAEPIRPRAIRGDIDDEVETIVLKCLQKDPSRRYQSAGDFGRDLGRYLAGEPIEAKTDSTWYVLRKTVHRFRAALTVAALFVLLLSISTTVAVVLSVRANRAAEDARLANEATLVAQHRAEQRLHESLIAQARAVRRSGVSGARTQAMAAMRRAAEIEPTLEVRSEVIAALAIPELEPLQRIERQGTAYFDVDFRRCAAGHADGSVTVFEVATNAELARIPTARGGIVELIGMTLRWPLLVRTFDQLDGPRRLEVWDIPAGQLRLELDDIPFRSRFDVSPDASRLAVGRLDQAIHIYDLATLEPVGRIALDRMPGYVCYDPTGKKLLLYHGEYSAPQLLDLETAEMTPLFDSPIIGWAVAWDPKGRWVAGAADNNIELWDVASEKRVAVLATHESRVVHLAASGDGSLLLSFSWDGNSVLWDMRTKRQILRFPHGRPVFSSDGFRIGGTLSEARREVIAIDRLDCGISRRLLGAWENVDSTAVSGGAFESQSGLVILISDISDGPARLRVYDPVAGRELASVGVDYAHSLATDRAGRFLVSAQRQGIYRWPLVVAGNHLAIGPPLRVGEITSPEAVTLSPDGSLVVAGHMYSGRFHITDLVHGGHRPLDVGHRCSGVRISPDGTLAAICQWYGRTTEVWDLQRGERLKTLPTGDFLSAEFGPRSDRLLTSDDTHITEWDVGTWKPVRQVEQHVAFHCSSRDGTLLATCSDATRIRLLDYQTLSELATLEAPEGFQMQGCSFSADGTQLVQITNRSGVAQLWDLRRIREELAAMGLDWDTPPCPPVDTGPHAGWTVTIDAGAVSGP